MPFKKKKKKPQFENIDIIVRTKYWIRLEILFDTGNNTRHDEKTNAGGIAKYSKRKKKKYKIICTIYRILYSDRSEGNVLVFFTTRLFALYTGLYKYI